MSRSLLPPREKGRGRGCNPLHLERTKHNMAMPMRSEEPEPGRDLKIVSTAKQPGGVVGFLKAEKSLALPALVMAANMAMERLGIAHSHPALSYLLEVCVFAAILFAAWGVVARAELLAEKYGEPYGTM